MMEENSTIISARQCAVEILHAVLDEKRPLDEALARHSALMLLSERDRGFARLMIMVTLRRLGQIDTLLSLLLEKPLVGKTNDVMHCLRLGATQLIWLETPPHAAVNAMVETVSTIGHERMKGLVNAVLKRVAKEGVGIIQAQDEAALTLPDWLYTSWHKAYGNATARAIATARLVEPPLDITVKSDAGGWAEKLGGIVLPTGSVRIANAGRVDALPGYAQGQWWVQDAAASIPVQSLGDIKGRHVLDLCAAPGGKTAQLLAKGALVTALDKSARRLELLRGNLARLSFSAELIEADILRFKPSNAYDIVLLDSPCSSTGTLRRHPEVAWHKSQSDVTELAALQTRLLKRAAGWVAPGGVLLYCVCSLQPEESEMQAKFFNREHLEFSVMPIKETFKKIAITDVYGGLRTHPACLLPQGGMDGFYTISWQRLNNS